MLLHEFKWKQDVLQSEEPVLVDFWASWCGPCQAMEPVLQSLARDYKVFKVNVDTNQPLAARYKVSSIPHLMVFQGGQIKAQHLGFTSEATLRSELQSLSGVRQA